MLTLIHHSLIFGKLSPVFNLKIMRDAGERFYSWVAKNRERLAEKTAPWLTMREENIRSSWVTSVIVFDLIVIMLWANLNYVKSKPLPSPFEMALHGLNLYQPWIMFIQTPAIRYWYVARGITKSGQVVDVYRHKKGEPSLLVPKHTAEGGWDSNYRWRKFVTVLWYPSLSHLRGYYAAYLCHQWNKTHPGMDKLERITVFYVVGGGPLNNPVEQYSWGEFDCTSPYAQGA
jgi:hypothetical protein